MLEERIFAFNSLAFAVRDKYPVTALHTLVIPRRQPMSSTNQGGHCGRSPLELAILAFLDGTIAVAFIYYFML
jgi:hypothetical protein